VLAQQIQLVVLVAVARQTELQQVLLERLTKVMPVVMLLMHYEVQEVEGVLERLALTEHQILVVMVELALHHL
jgi:ABC-type Fe3+-citrate transport system substrate-binding protein